MKRRQWIVGGLASAGIPALDGQACLWDRDTLAQEAAKSPGYVTIITGRFPRNPDSYYAMRLERVTGELQNRPNLLELYDDAGVCCDRLGRGEEALDWMERKRARIDAIASGPETDEHRYRYLANLGTFEIHDWLRRGSTSLAYLDQAEAARDHIAAAIRLNPRAHFGREKYQFLAIDWIIRCVKKETESPFFLEEGPRYRAALRDLDLDHSSPSQGIAGLVYLGNAWQSADVFRNLGKTFEDIEQASIAHLAYLRAEEIIDKGGESFSRGGEFRRQLMIDDIPRKQNARYFLDARREADRWLAHRNAFLESQFAKGLHPDTHPDFWTGYTDRSAPPKFLREKVR